MLWVEEGRPGSNIETLGESLWWAFVTVFTVGYGDYTPVTPAGRVIGVILMFVGVGVIAIFTASVATRFLSARDSRQGVPGRVIAEEEATLDVVLARLESLEARLVAGGVMCRRGPPATRPRTRHAEANDIDGIRALEWARGPGGEARAAQSSPRGSTRAWTPHETPAGRP